ncbi:hypothetical protein [Bacillus solimangrovi]|uniref:Polymerase nucleotidyl transferase domain-containing protein n=1 Tax=Bacillus solimangrovi TaxID=1305675 RepID=A0A1E5LJM5_9BACI|nr:hypothetical protein [Bacillus solimangrovi]OEH94284.1 hypothetical protein BFG57_08480 [Bacillus solimangrovi]
MKTEDINLLNSYDLTEEKILEIIPTYDEDVVFLSGSIIEGFGNKGSDLDVYVVSNKNDVLIPQSINSVELPYGKEYTFLGNKILISAIVIQEEVFKSLIVEIDKKIKNRQISVLDKKSIELYHRLHLGLPIKNQNNFTKLTNLLDIGTFRHNLCKNRLSYSENRHEDAVGALESKDYWTAFLSARISLEKSVESLLYIKGETNPSDKWLFRKLFKHFSAEEEWVKGFLELYSGNGGSKNIQENTVEMIRLANSIRMMSYTLLKSTDN